MCEMNCGDGDKVCIDCVETNVIYFLNGLKVTDYRIVDFMKENGVWDDEKNAYVISDEWMIKAFNDMMDNVKLYKKDYVAMMGYLYTLCMRHQFKLVMAARSHVSKEARYFALKFLENMTDMANLSCLYDAIQVLIDDEEFVISTEPVEVINVLNIISSSADYIL